MSEVLQWIDPAHAMPDADERVLVWLRQLDGTAEWDSARWDGVVWLLEWCGAPPEGKVVAWARPEGPAA